MEFACDVDGFRWRRKPTHRKMRDVWGTRHRAAIPPELLSSGGGLHPLGGLFNQSCDSLWLRHVDGMAALDLNDRGARPLGHGTLGIGWDHLVVGGDQVPARLGPPRRFTDLAAESLHAPRDLRVSHESGSFCVHIGCEGSAELRPIEEQIAVLRRQYRRDGWAGRRAFEKRWPRPTPVWSKCGGIHQHHTP